MAVAEVGLGEAPIELIAVVYRQDELAMILSRLEDAGIWSFRLGEAQVRIDPAMAVAIGGVRIFVHRDEAGEARGLLTAGGAWERSSGVYDRSPALDWVFALLLVLMTGTPPPARIRSVIISPVSRVSR